ALEAEISQILFVSFHLNVSTSFRRRNIQAVRDDIAGHRYPELCKRMFLAVLKSLSVQNQDGERNSVALAIQDDAERILQFTPHGWLVGRKTGSLGSLSPACNR